MEAAIMYILFFILSQLDFLSASTLCRIPIMTTIQDVILKEFKHPHTLTCINRHSINVRKKI